MAERDSTNTPVAAEALIAAAAAESLALHSIAPGCPHPSFRRRRAPRRCPSRRPLAASPSARPRRPQLPRARTGATRVR